MLEELRIRSLGVIDEAVVEFGPGLNVVTGETGAGKTMVLTALGLLMGARADPALVRQGARQAAVEGSLAVGDDEATLSRVAELGGVVEEGVLLLGRTVASGGRSRAVAGGSAVPAAVLTELTGERIVVHGQSAQQGLLRPARQRECLDAYGGKPVADTLRDFRETYRRLREMRTELDEIVANARERAREADLLAHGVAEIEVVGPQPGEDTELRAEEQRLAHADALRRAAELARAALIGDESGYEDADAASLVAGARKALDEERANDPALAALADRLAGVSFDLVDAAADIASYGASVEADPIRLAAVSERRAALGSLTRKYGDSIDDVLAWAVSAQERLAELGDDTSRIDRLRGEAARLSDDLAAHSGRLSRHRREAAERLGAAVTAELAALAMPHAVLAAEVRPLGEPGPDGADEIAFTLASAAGAAAVPLARGASGGELSRVMLALEVCLAGATPPATMVFDEVDAGVGGTAAVEVGRRLARLAQAAQVIVVTHLPQVAAFADRHHVVVRSDDGVVTTSGVTVLDEPARRRELSRMLAGLEGSATAEAHAAELLELAADDSRS